LDFDLIYIPINWSILVYIFQANWAT